MRLVDGTVERVAQIARSAAIPTPSVLGLSALRARAAERALVRARPEAEALAGRLAAGDVEARTALATLAERTLSDMRRELHAEAAREGLVHALAARLDARFHETDASEWLDDPAFDRRARVRVLEHLDALNTMVGGYAAFFDALRPHLRREGSPTKVLDLAAGHGGFALEAARIARREGLAIELHATDLKAEYLELGERIARRDGLDVRFEVQDALDLSNLAPGAFDVIVCTQSLHHFSAGQVAVLAAEASRVAGRAVVLVDGCRSRIYAALVGALGLARFADVAFAHDAWVSFRRFFAPEELALLARLGPHGEGVRARWMPPTHCLAEIELG